MLIISPWKCYTLDKMIEIHKLPVGKKYFYECVKIYCI